jgi:phosphate transport system substrate-binding protein
VSTLVFTAPAQAGSYTLNGGGSSFDNNAFQACLSTYTDNTVTYDSQSSGTGRAGLVSGTYDWAGSDGTYAGAVVDAQGNVTKAADAQPTKYVMVPVLGGPIVIAYSVPTAGDGLQLTPKVISEIFKGEITSWADPQIKALNPKLRLPDASANGFVKNLTSTGTYNKVISDKGAVTYVAASPANTGKYDYSDKYKIKVAYRASGSGTTANLVNYLKQTSTETWDYTNNPKDLPKAATLNQVGGTFAPVSQSFTTSADLASYVEDTTWSFGYFDLSDALSADVSLAKIQNAAGAFVAPTASAAAKFLAAQTIITAANTAGADQRTIGTLALDYTKNVTGAYQLSAPSYLVAKISATGKDPKNLAIGAWAKYLVSTCMPAKAAGLGYVALTGALKASALAAIKTIG